MACISAVARTFSENSKCCFRPWLHYQLLFVPSARLIAVVRAHSSYNTNCLCVCVCVFMALLPAAVCVRSQEYQLIFVSRVSFLCRWTALMQAAAGGHLSVVNALLARGASANHVRLAANSVVARCCLPPKHMEPTFRSFLFSSSFSSTPSVSFFPNTPPFL